MYVLIGLVLLLASSADAGTVVGTRHDFSTTTSPEVCVFCHTPHFANPDQPGPLWNRAVPDAGTFTPYDGPTESPTMDTTPGPPSDISRLCLGCHDGVLAFKTVDGFSVSTKHDLLFYHGRPDTQSYPNCERCHPEFFGTGPEIVWTGTDLRDDHPISMTYPTAGQDPEFETPPDPTNGWSDVILVGGKVECVSCHNVHDNTIEPFLNKSNAGSALCLTCHDKG